jgi:carotenoid cleavage dioxygenase-like enzyme
MIRMYRFGDGKVSYRSRFFRTEKFKEEQSGRPGSFKYPGKLRRLIVNKTTRSAREEILDDVNNEFPVVDERVHCLEHRNIYFIQATKNALWWSKKCALRRKNRRLRRL